MSKKVNKSQRDNRQNKLFVCMQCGLTVNVDNSGTAHRNHCPRCLWSRHVDINPGDRQASCGGMMEPIAISVHKSEWSIVHRCRRCGSLDVNCIAGDDNELILVSIAAKPLAQPPFPLHIMEMVDSV